jgi:hypothetical protein
MLVTLNNYLASTLCLQPFALPLQADAPLQLFAAAGAVVMELAPQVAELSGVVWLAQPATNNDKAEAAISKPFFICTQSS